MSALTHVDLSRHPIGDRSYAAHCRDQLDQDGALVLAGFLTPLALNAIRAETEGRGDEAFFTTESHNVYLTPPDSSLPDGHVFNRQIASSKGCLADDQIHPESRLRELYESPTLRRFLCGVLGVEVLHAYADNLSSINVHYHQDGQELGWHFDNSSFAVTLLVQEPLEGGRFEYVSDLRDADAGDLNLAGVEAALDSGTGAQILDFSPGDLVIFRGRDSLHRVTPSRGDRTRILVVFAYNTEPDIGLSDQAKETFYGRVG